MVFFCDHYILRFNIPMDYIMRMAMFDCLKDLPHVLRRLLLAKLLTFLCGNLVEEWLALGKLHHQVYVLGIVVRFVVVDDVGVVQRVKQHDFIHDVVKVGLQLHFVHDFDGDLQTGIKVIVCGEDFAERATSQNFRIIVNLVVMLEFFGTLLFRAAANLDFLLLPFLLQFGNLDVFLRTIDCVIFWSIVAAPHLHKIFS